MANRFHLMRRREHRAYPSIGTDELRLIQSSYKRRQYATHGLALLMLALFFFGILSSQAGLGGERFFVFTSIGVGLLSAAISTAVWHCPRCGFDFTNRRIIVERCPECGVQLEPDAPPSSP